MMMQLLCQSKHETEKLKMLKRTKIWGALGGFLGGFANGVPSDSFIFNNEIFGV